MMAVGGLCPGGEGSWCCCFGAMRVPPAALSALALGFTVLSGTHVLRGHHPGAQSAQAGVTPGTSAHLATSPGHRAAQPWLPVCLGYKRLGVLDFKTICCQPTGQFRNLQVFPQPPEIATRSLAK